MLVFKFPPPPMLLTTNMFWSYLQPSSGFDVHRVVPCNIICIVRPTRCSNVSNLFYFGMRNDTLHCSDGLSVHHEELKPVHTATGICQTDSAAVCLQISDYLTYLSPKFKETTSLLFD